MQHEGAEIVSKSPRRTRSGYQPPDQWEERQLSDLLAIRNRSVSERQAKLFPKDGAPAIYCAGNLGLLAYPCVSVIGARNVSRAGELRTERIARELAINGVTVVSGLAMGVDVTAHRAAINAGGYTIAVIGTPLDRAYPAENAPLQEDIYRHHLLLSQFSFGQRTYPSDFPKRNRVMAALSDASVIVEASDTSGTLHQAAECMRLGRWLFIMKSVAENPALDWPKKFLGHDRAVILNSSQDILDRICG